MGRKDGKEGVKKENENERKRKGNREWQMFVLTLTGGNKDSNVVKTLFCGFISAVLFVLFALGISRYSES